MTIVPALGVLWPDGKRCAACVGWDVDADSLVLHRRRDRGFELHASLSWLRYDEVALPRVVEVLNRLGLKQTFFVCGWCLERYPAMCDPVVDGGHEVAYHGYLHQAPNELSPEQELAELHRGIELVERFTGRRPTGSRVPYAALSSRSAALLVEEGFLYDSSLLSDSRPFVVRAGGGELIELPIDMTLSDRPHYAFVPDLGTFMQPKSPSAPIDLLRLELEAAYELSGLRITIWHPHVSGRPARLLAWVTLIEETLERGDVWFATLDEIARHVRSCREDGTYDAPVISLPYYESPPAAFAESGP